MNKNDFEIMVTLLLNLVSKKLLFEFKFTSIYYLNIFKKTRNEHSKKIMQILIWKKLNFYCYKIISKKYTNLCI